MKTITARELRNEYARILRELEGADEGYTITNHGRPVARITPIAPVPDRLRSFSGVPLDVAAGLNSASGPFDHLQAERQVAAVLDPVARDPYAGRDDESNPDADGRIVQDLVHDTDRPRPPSGPRLDDLAERIAQERSRQQ